MKLNLHNKEKDNDEDRYFDEELYKKRTVIKYSNARMDGFKRLLIKYEVQPGTKLQCNRSPFQYFSLKESTNKQKFK